METAESHSAESETAENRSRPAPRSGTVAAVETVKTCLHQWTKEVEAETSGMRSYIAHSHTQRERET